MAFVLLDGEKKETKNYENYFHKPDIQSGKPGHSFITIKAHSRKSLFNLATVSVYCSLDTSASFHIFFVFRFVFGLNPVLQMRKALSWCCCCLAMVYKKVINGKSVRAFKKCLSRRMDNGQSEKKKKAKNCEILIWLWLSFFVGGWKFTKLNFMFFNLVIKTNKKANFTKEWYSPTNCRLHRNFIYSKN